MSEPGTLHLAALDYSRAVFRRQDQLGISNPSFELTMRASEWWERGRPVELPITLGPVPA